MCPSALALFNLTGSQDDATSNLLRLFAQVESASSVLAWSSSSVRALGSECEVSIVQLHRINARFDIKANEEGTLRLQSAEYEGLFVRDDHHILSLRHADQMWGPSQRASSKATLAATGLVRPIWSAHLGTPRHSLRWFLKTLLFSSKLFCCLGWLHAQVP